MLLLLPGHAGAHESGATPRTGDEAVAVTNRAQELTPSRPLLLEALLPPAAKQGRERWYLVHFTASLSGMGEIQGLATLKSALGGWTTNAVEFTRASSKDGCESGGVRWQTIDLFKGVRNRVTCSRTLRLTSDNFVPYGSIRPGRGKLAISLSPGLGPDTHLEIAAGAGLYATALGPAEIKLDVSNCRRIRRLSGRWIEVPIGIRNRGERPASRVRVGAEPVPGVDIKSERSRPLRIPAGEIRRVLLRIRTHRTGLVPLRLLAVSNANQAAAVCRLRLRSSKRTQGGFLGTGLPSTMSGVVSLLLACFGLGVFLILIRRKKEALA